MKLIPLFLCLSIRLFGSQAIELFPLADGSNGTAITSTAQPSSHQAIDVTAYQLTSPWVDNISQIGGNAVVTAGVNGLLAVGGNVASGSADSGNPIRGAGKYNMTLPTYSDGNRAGFQSDVNGKLLTVDGYAQNSTTSGESGPLVQGAVTTAGPSYTDGKTMPLSLDTGGLLRVTIGGGSVSGSGGNDLSGLVAGNKLFSTSFNLSATSAGTDNNTFLFRNPNASGKRCYFWFVGSGTDVANVNVTIKMWSSPTVTDNGTAQTVTNRNIGSGVTNVCLVNTAPTTTSQGTQFESFVNGQNTNSLFMAQNFSVGVPPNTSVLVTADPSSNNRSVQYTVLWAEE